MQGDTQQLRHVCTGALAGCGHLLQCSDCRRTLSLGRQGLGLLHVGRIVTLGAVNNGVLARSGDHLELFTQITANGTGIGRYCTVGQAEAVKNPAVGLGHDLVAGLCSRLIPIEAVGVFHRELSSTHQAKARTALVTKFGLDLVEIARQLFVAAQFLACDVSDHFLAGGLDHVVTAMAVLDAQQFGAHGVKAPGFLPELGRLHHGHGQFHRPSAVHFLAHDGFYLLYHAQAHGHVGIDPSCELLDHSGAHHELVADHLGIGGGFLEGGNEELGGFHRTQSGWRGCTTLAAHQAACIMDAV